MSDSIVPQQGSSADLDAVRRVLGRSVDLDGAFDGDVDPSGEAIDPELMRRVSIAILDLDFQSGDEEPTWAETQKAIEGAGASLAQYIEMCESATFKRIHMRMGKGMVVNRRLGSMLLAASRKAQMGSTQELKMLLASGDDEGAVGAEVADLTRAGPKAIKQRCRELTRRLRALAELADPPEKPEGALTKASSKVRERMGGAESVGRIDPTEPYRRT